MMGETWKQRLQVEFDKLLKETQTKRMEYIRLLEEKAVIDLFKKECGCAPHAPLSYIEELLLKDERPDLPLTHSSLEFLSDRGKEILDALDFYERDQGPLICIEFADVPNEYFRVTVPRECRFCRVGD